LTYILTIVEINYSNFPFYEGVQYNKTLSWLYLELNSLQNAHFSLFVTSAIICILVLIDTK